MFWRFEDGGKLPLFDVVLHGWVRIFGDSLFAMRAMSAALGTVAIVLLFVAVREICRALGGEACAETGEVAGAFAALIYALNLTMVLSHQHGPRISPADHGGAGANNFFGAARSATLPGRTIWASRFSPRSCSPSTTPRVSCWPPKRYGSAACCSPGGPVPRAPPNIAIFAGIRSDGGSRASGAGAAGDFRARHVPRWGIKP